MKNREFGKLFLLFQIIHYHYSVIWFCLNPSFLGKSRITIFLSHLYLWPPQWAVLSSRISIILHFTKQICDLDNNSLLTRVLPGSGRERDDGESQTPGQGGPQPGLGPGARHPAGQARAAGARCSTLPQVWSAFQIFRRCNINFLNAHVLVYGWRVHSKHLKIIFNLQRTRHSCYAVPYERSSLFATSGAIPWAAKPENLSWA